MSNETRFTPGPWWVEPETGDVVAKDGDWEICTFSRSDMNHEHDTYLIAAAPDGYAFAEAVESMIVDGGLTDDAAWGPILIQCREFMGKARGEP